MSELQCYRACIRAANQGVKGNATERASSWAVGCNASLQLAPQVSPEQFVNPDVDKTQVNAQPCLGLRLRVGFLLADKTG